MTWPKDKPAKAVYKCPHCHHEITEQEKLLMLQQGEWRPTAEGPPGVRGFHLWEGYSPWSSFGEIATDFIEAKRGGRDTLQQWVNESLGETFEEDQGERPEWATLQARAEPYHVLSVPAGGVFLTAGVDVTRQAGGGHRRLGTWRGIMARLLRRAVRRCLAARRGVDAARRSPDPRV